MPGRDSRPTWVVVAAMLIVVALIAAVLGASISSLTGNDDGPASQASPGVTATPGASPTPFGKDFISATSTSADPTDAAALAAEAVANLRSAERFRFELALGGGAEQALGLPPTSTPLLKTRGRGSGSTGRSPDGAAPSYNRVRSAGYRRGHE